MGSTQHLDFLVLGGGIAGLSFALRVAKRGSVGILFKKSEGESSTAWAQGGIATVQSTDDSPDLHVADTLRAGAGLCDEGIVRLVVNEGVRLLPSLLEWGVQFDRLAPKGEFDLHQEGGHTRRRILHAADSTGREIQRALLAAAHAERNITFLENHSAIDLITSHKMGIELERPNAVVGAYVLGPDGKPQTILAKKVLVATGGAGKVYLYTSNPDVATGDGIAMCFRAGVPVANLEFYQFHPTCLYHPKAKSFLITEAMRGEGAVLRTIGGTRFMLKYDERGELASRDIVARAIDHEMKASGDEYVLLDISHRPAGFVKEHFPAIYAQCKQYGYDITAEPIPVVPAAHYCCGGVVCDGWGATRLENLYVAGEVACTGLHGANRLASNSLLEGLVFGCRAAEHALSNLDARIIRCSPAKWDAGSATDSDEDVIISHNWDEIRRLMWNYVGIVRTNKRLERALRRSNLILREVDEYYWNFHVTPDLLELRNLSLVANLVIQSAIARKESRGLHYNLDFPGLDPRINRRTIIDPAVWYHYNFTRLYANQR